MHQLAHSSFTTHLIAISSLIIDTAWRCYSFRLLVAVMQIKLIRQAISIIKAMQCQPSAVRDEQYNWHAAPTAEKATRNGISSSSLMMTKFPSEHSVVHSAYLIFFFTKTKTDVDFFRFDSVLLCLATFPSSTTVLLCAMVVLFSYLSHLNGGDRFCITVICQPYA